MSRKTILCTALVAACALAAAGGVSLTALSAGAALFALVLALALGAVVFRDYDFPAP